MRAALAMIRRCFHGMNRLGATTYWETFSPEWNELFNYGADGNVFCTKHRMFAQTGSGGISKIFEIRHVSAGDPTPNSQTGYMSHCHPWASGAAPWLTHHVLGLHPTGAGWETWEAKPFLDSEAPNLLSR